MVEDRAGTQLYRLTQECSSYIHSFAKKTAERVIYCALIISATFGLKSPSPCVCSFTLKEEDVQ